MEQPLRLQYAYNHILEYSVSMAFLLKETEKRLCSTFFKYGYTLTGITPFEKLEDLAGNSWLKIMNLRTHRMCSNG